MASDVALYNIVPLSIGENSVVSHSTRAVVVKSIEDPCTVLASNPTVMKRMCKKG